MNTSLGFLLPYWHPTACSALTICQRTRGKYYLIDGIRSRSKKLTLGQRENGKFLLNDPSETAWGMTYLTHHAFRRDRNMQSPISYLIRIKKPNKNSNSAKSGWSGVCWGGLSNVFNYEWSCISQIAGKLLTCKENRGHNETLEIRVRIALATFSLNNQFRSCLCRTSITTKTQMHISCHPVKSLCFTFSSTCRPWWMFLSHPFLANYTV